MKYLLFLTLFSSQLLAASYQLNYFDKIQANAVFEESPKIFTMHNLELEINGEKSIYENEIEVKLYHPELGLYSNPTFVKQISSNQFYISNVFFIAAGLWEIQVHIEGLKRKFTIQIAEYNPIEEIKTHEINYTQTYYGNEYLNDKPTGQTCYIVIDRVEENPKGKHCYDITWQFMSTRTDIPRDVLRTSSRITNYHRSEYPHVKTCAMSVDGKTSGMDIYQDNAELLVNEIFSGSHKENKGEFHYFLTPSFDTKNLTRARIHGRKMFKKWNVDCLNLKLVK